MKDSIRSFIAVEIDDANKDRVLSLMTDLKKSDADVKWADRHQMHLTLKFLGNVEKKKIDEINSTLDSIVKNFQAFTIKLSNIGSFPSMKNMRVIWLGIDKGFETLKGLSIRIEDGLNRIGFNRSERDFKAHLTLGRVRSTKNIKHLVELINDTAIQFQDEIKIEKLIFYQSTLTPKGAIYTQIKEFHFIRALS